MKNLLEVDQNSVWHPYTQHGLGESPLPVTRAFGSYLELADGTQILDGISSWWVNLLGHCHPEIAKAVQKQAETLDHVLFAGFTHSPAVELADLILHACQKRGVGFSKVFFSDNGSTAVEVALKMAFQSQKLKGDHQRSRFLALSGSYHGDTFGAMAVGEPAGFHSCFRSLLAPVDFTPPGNLNFLQGLLKERGKEYSALIVEPLIQAAGGMKIYSRDYLVEAVKLCREHGILIIFDEIFTGFYRTGTAFAFEQVGLAPDFICLSKCLTGGFLPLALTLTHSEIFEAFRSNQLSTAFLHGHSYTANPIACAAAVATWKELQKDEVQRKIQTICEITRQRIGEFKKNPKVENARCLGTIGAIELKGQSGYFSQMGPRIKKEALSRGVLLRPLGNVIYTVPPLSISESELHRIYDVMLEIV